jgi:uncharacterized membrane protein
VSFARPLLLVLVAPAIVAAIALSARLSRGRRLRATLRALALAAVAAALAGPRIAAGGPGTRVELVDASASFRGRRALGEGFLRELGEAAARDTAPRARFRTVRLHFGDGVGPDARPGGTDIAAAIRAAVAIAGEGGDVVLVSDGLATEPGALDAAREAAARGIPVHVHLPSDPGLPALAIEEVRAPVRIAPGEPFSAEVGLVWNGLLAPSGDAPPPGIPPGAPLPVALVLARGEEILAEARLEMPAGGGRASARLTLAADHARALGQAGGLVRLAIEVRSALAGDPLPEARRAEAAFVLAGRPRVLAVGAAPPPLEGFDARPARPDEVPSDAADLAPYAAVLLADVPARALGPARMAALDAYAAAGGGLLALGARQAFGPGGYAETPLERALPVRSNPAADAGERVAIAVLLDRSGSMNEPAGPGLSKFAAAVAALGALDRLLPRDRVAVFLFSTGVEEAAPLGPPGGAALRAALAGVRPSGGTDVFPAIEAGLQTLAGADAERRHAVLVSDGRSDATPDPAAALARLAALRAERPAITLSVVAVGADADEPLLREIARAGGGRFERAGAGLEPLEDVLARELDPRREDLFVAGPLAVRPGEGPGPTTPPPASVADAVRVAAKPAARVALVAAGAGPLLALGARGAGRAAAFASDDAAAFAPAIAWALREVARPETAPGVTFRATPEGAMLRLTADVRAADGGFRSGLALAAAIAGRGAERLAEVAPGLYRAEVPLPAEPLLISLCGDADGAARPLATTVFVPPRPLEFAGTAPDRALLRAIAATTGGRALERGGPPPPAPRGQGAGRSVAWILALAAALLILADLAAEAALTRPARKRGPAAV